MSGQEALERAVALLAERGGERVEQRLAQGPEQDGARDATRGMVTVVLQPSEIVEAVRALREVGFDLLSDIFGIDYLLYPGHRGKRFAVVYNLYSIAHNVRLFLRLWLDEGERVPSITGVWRAASFMEREVHEMFGVVFEGHPDLRRLITPEDLEGYPHRKDYPIGETPTLFNDGRFIDPAAFRAGLMGHDPGLTGWKGGARKGVRSAQGLELVAHEITGEGGES